MPAPRVKPAHLGAEYAAQFGDEEVAAAYRHRPPYLAETFDIVERLLGPRPRPCWSWAPAPETSRSASPRASTTSSPSSLRAPCWIADGGVRAPTAPTYYWLAVRAEDGPIDRRYSAVVAAEAFHWLDSQDVLPRIGASLIPDGWLILVERGLAEPVPWEPDLRSLTRECSTNREYVA